jgi:hypothetical protein
MLPVAAVGAAGDAAGASAAGREEATTKARLANANVARRASTMRQLEETA